MAKAKFPLDTVIDILSRLPVKYLARFRCVSKRCSAYLDDDLLAVLHAQRYVEELTPIMYDPYESCAFSFDIINSEEGETTLEAKKGMSLDSKLRLSVRGSCNGLLYLSHNHIPELTSLAVIHPLRKEYHELAVLPRWFDGPYCRGEDGSYCLDEEARGLGFDVSTNTFKMVCVLSKRYGNRVTSDSVSKKLCTMVHVLGSGSFWREIPQVPPKPTSGDGISANGCLYWLISYKESWQIKFREEFICFDLRNEEFSLINPPKKRSGYSVTCQLAALDGELGYAYFYSDNIIEVWVLNQNQWAKHCQFDMKLPLYYRSRHDKVLGFWNKDGDILIETGAKKLFVYSLKDRRLNEVNIAGHRYNYHNYNASIYMCPANSLSSVRPFKKPTYLTQETPLC